MPVCKKVVYLESLLDYGVFRRIHRLTANPLSKSLRASGDLFDEGFQRKAILDLDTGINY